MKKIPLADLPRWSKWPERMLNPGEPASRPRTAAQVEKEYDQGKYAKCLMEFERRDGQPTPEEVKQFEHGQPADHQMCVALEDQLFVMSLREAREAYYQCLADTLRPRLKPAGTIVELGSGYGFHCWMLKKRFPEIHVVGAESSENAVRLAALLYGHLPPADGVQIRRFNFHEEQTYAFMRELPKPVTVFTSHAIQPYASAEIIVRHLARLAGHVADVFHFEPVGELHDTDLLGLFRRRYCEIHNYNRDLLTCLRANPGVRLISATPNVVGLNPLNPTSVLEWQPIT